MQKKKDEETEREKKMKQEILDKGSIHKPNSKLGSRVRAFINGEAPIILLFIIATLIIPGIGEFLTDSTVVFNDEAQSIFLPNRFLKPWVYIISWGIICISLVLVIVLKVKAKITTKLSIMYIGACMLSLLLTILMFCIFSSASKNDSLTIFSMLDHVGFDGEYIILDDSKIKAEVSKEDGNLTLTIPNTEGYELVKDVESKVDRERITPEQEYNYFE